MKQIQLIPSFHQKAKENEIYIKNNRPLAAYKKRIFKLLKKDIKQIHVLALSSATIKVVTIVQQIRKEFPLVQYNITTDTIECFHLKNEEIQKSKRSCMKITLIF